MKIEALQYPVVIAHRGYSEKYPENTMGAFQAALDAKADMIELDVTLTRDRQIVVIHDDKLDRTTNGKGRVGDYPLKKLKTLDAGKWFDRRFSDERIPTLEDALDLANGRICVNIEIKSSAYEPHHPEDAIEKQVIELIQQKKMLDGVIISSFEWRFLKNIRRISEVPIISLLSDKSVGSKAIEYCQRLKAFSWHQNQKYIDSDLVAKMHNMGIRVFAYTVNSVKRSKQLLDMGVDGIFTNDPVLLRIKNPALK